MIVPIPYVHVGMGLLAILLSVPLILRTVPMNCVYGIRVRKAYVSEENWYRINAFGGKAIFAFGLFLLGFSFFAPVNRPSNVLW